MDACPAAAAAFSGATSLPFERAMALPLHFPRPEADMATFITIGYGDEAGYRRTDEPTRDAAHAHDRRLKAAGARIGIAGTPTQVRNHGNKGVQTTRGAFLHSALPIAGFAVVEAKDMDEAVALVSKAPCAVAYGVVEVWPLEEQ